MLVGMDYHNLLRMQLDKQHLDVEVLPCDLSAWKRFIESVHRSYVNDDNDRYLLERSMQLSSSEMKKLNDMLENSQRIARMGYWIYDIATNKITWSKQAYYIFGLNNADNANNAEKLYALIKEEYRQLFKEKIETALLDRKEFACEIQIKNPDKEAENEFRWYSIIGKPILDNSVNKVIYISFVSVDITFMKNSEDELQKLNHQLIISARRAGMADVAT